MLFLVTYSVFPWYLPTENLNKISSTKLLTVISLLTSKPEINIKIKSRSIKIQDKAVYLIEMHKDLEPKTDL